MYQDIKIEKNVYFYKKDIELNSQPIRRMTILFKKIFWKIPLIFPPLFSLRIRA
jgi:hypothetical protein